MTLRFKTVLLLTVPPICWAGNAVVGRAVVGEFPPLALSWLRWTLACLLLVPWVWRDVVAQWRLLCQHKGVVAWISLLGVGLYNSFQYLALQTSPALNVTLIASSTPVFILLVGALFFGERIGRAQALGAVVSVLGVMVVMVRGQWAELLQWHIAAGDAWMLAAAAAWAVYTWLLRRRRPPMDLAPFLVVQMALGSAFIAPFAGLEAAGGAHVQWSERTALALLFVATLPSLAAYWCWDRGVREAGAVLPVYFANLTPLFAALLGAALLGERPQIYHAVGLVLIVVGIHLAAQQPQENSSHCPR